MNADGACFFIFYLLDVHDLHVVQNFWYKILFLRCALLSQRNDFLRENTDGDAAYDIPAASSSASLAWISLIVLVQVRLRPLVAAYGSTVELYQYRTVVLVLIAPVQKRQSKNHATCTVPVLL